MAARYSPNASPNAYLNTTTQDSELNQGQSGLSFMAAYAWSASLLQYVKLGVDASGNLLTVGGGGGGGNAAAGLTGAAVPTSADYQGWNSGGNLVGTSLTNALPIQPGTGASFAVTGTFFQATQPVSGTVAVSNFPATQAVSGTVAATQSGTWTVQQGTPPWLVSQSGIWTTGRTWTLNSGTDSVTLVPSGTQTVSGVVSVSNFPVTQPISAVSLPLPTNAAQETGGNLSSLVSLETNLQQLVEIQRMMLAVLKSIHLQEGTAYGIQINPSDMLEDFTTQ